MGSFLLGLLPKFLAAFISRRLDAWQARRAMRELGASEERERQGDATVDVLEKNAEAVTEADAMSDAEMRRRLTDGGS